MSGECVFCDVARDDVLLVADGVVGIWDLYPVSPGHILLITADHISDWFSAALHDQINLISAVPLARDEILKRYSPDGFNIGVNVGEWGGQTVGHLHVHVIPRYAGDVRDPRGGVRHVIPGRGNYCG